MYLYLIFSGCFLFYFPYSRRSPVADRVMRSRAWLAIIIFRPDPRVGLLTSRLHPNVDRAETNSRYGRRWTAGGAHNVQSTPSHRPLYVCRQCSLIVVQTMQVPSCSDTMTSESADSGLCDKSIMLRKHRKNVFNKSGESVLPTCYLFHVDFCLCGLPNLCDCPFYLNVLSVLIRFLSMINDIRPR